jgi:hypothetical protein
VNVDKDKHVSIRNVDVKMEPKCLIVWDPLVRMTRTVDRIKSVQTDIVNVKTAMKFFRIVSQQNAQRKVIAHQGRHVAIRNVSVKMGP